MPNSLPSVKKTKKTNCKIISLKKKHCFDSAEQSEPSIKAAIIPLRVVKMLLNAVQQFSSSDCILCAYEIQKGCGTSRALRAGRQII